MTYLCRAHIVRITYQPGSDLIVVNSSGEWLAFTGEQADKDALLADLLTGTSPWIELPDALEVSILREFEPAKDSTEQ